MADRDHTDPDAPASPEEQAHAAAFGELVEGLLTGAAPPPALDADERSLLEAATMAHAGAGAGAELSATRTAALLDGVYGGPGKRDAGDTADDKPGPDVTDLAAEPAAVAVAPLRRRVSRALPWAVAATAAAAALLLALRQVPAPGSQTAHAPPLPAELHSRTADRLVGRIDRSEAHLASARLDAIYADRLNGYRTLRYGGQR